MPIVRHLFLFYNRIYMDSLDTNTKLGTSTFGEILPEVRFEAVLSPGRANSLQFHFRQGVRFGTSPQVRHQESIYVPAKLAPGLGQAVLFPPPSRNFGSPAKLVASMSELISNFGNIPGDDASLLAAFAL